MRAEFSLMVALSGLLGALPTFADERPIELNTDLKGQYFIVEQSGAPNALTLVTRRATGEKSVYTKQELDCEARTARLLANGSSIDALVDLRPLQEATPIEPGTIVDQLAAHVCPKP